jgi:hypothetical protein
VAKIERWWIREGELPTNPDFDGQEVAAEDIHSWGMLFLQMMVHIATGDDVSVYWAEFQRLSSRSYRTGNGRN